MKTIQQQISDLPKLATLKNNGWIKYYNKNKKKIVGMDVKIRDLHDHFSSKIDCLQCANCCKTLGPRITQKDVDKMAKYLRIKPNNLIDKYLYTDEDGDLVFKTMPCPFLGADNYCSIYDARPKACSEYPHTDRKKFYQIYHLSIKNASTCPIVYEVMEEIVKL